MTPKDILINWHGLIKNRQGPYKILYKRADSDVYYDFSTNKWITNIAFAYDYSLCPRGFCGVFKDCEIDISFGLAVKVVLTTAAGDIELKETNIKEQWRC